MCKAEEGLGSLQLYHAAWEGEGDAIVGRVGKHRGFWVGEERQFLKFSQDLHFGAGLEK